MDTASPINTGNSQESQNPQDTGAPGANDASDFQSTAPASTLNEQTQNLSVQKTGDPATASKTNNATDGLPTSWIVGIVLIVLIGGYVFYKLLKETIEETTESMPVARPKAVSTKRAGVSAKKATSKKKPAPNRRKKNTRKRK